MSELEQALIKHVQDTKDFMLEQLPDIYQQIITWGILSNSLSLLTCIVLSLLLSVYLYHKFKKISKNEGVDDALYFLTPIGLFAAIGAIIWAYSCIENLLMLCITPKIYLLKLLGFSL